MTEPRKTTIVPEPAPGTRIVFLRKRESPLYSGNASTGPNVICGSCSTVLIENAINPSFDNIVFQCPSCKSFGEVLSN